MAGTHCPPVPRLTHPPAHTHTHTHTHTRRILRAVQIKAARVYEENVLFVKKHNDEVIIFLSFFLSFSFLLFFLSLLSSR